MVQQRVVFDFGAASIKETQNIYDTFASKYHGVTLYYQKWTAKKPTNIQLVVSVYEDLYSDCGYMYKKMEINQLKIIEDNTSFLFPGVYHIDAISINMTKHPWIKTE